MRRRTHLGVIALVTLALLPACGGESEPPPAEHTTSASDEPDPYPWREVDARWIRGEPPQDWEVEYRNEYSSATHTTGCMVTTQRFRNRHDPDDDPGDRVVDYQEQLPDDAERIETVELSFDADFTDQPIPFASGTFEYTDRDGVDVRTHFGVEWFGDFELIIGWLCPIDELDDDGQDAVQEYLDNVSIAEGAV